MQTIRKVIPIFCFILIAYASFQFLCDAEEFQLKSPDQSIQCTINLEKEVSFSIEKDKQTMVFPSTISMDLQNGYVLGKDARISKVERRTIDQIIKPVVKEKRNAIRDHYHELRIQLGPDYALRFRAYDEGVAYRWETDFSNSIIIESEEVQFRFSDQDQVYITKDTTLQSNYEKPYITRKVSELLKEDFGGLPVLVRKENEKNVLIAESGLEDYPGLWIRGNGNSRLTGIFPGYPKEVDNKGRVKTYADYIAKTEGTRSFPWRILAIAGQDSELLTNQLVYLLAPPLRIKDPSWIKPGQIILDWWARRNVFDVDFEAGVNTETMKYFIDFCAHYGIDYFLLDEGWSSRQDVLKVNPDVAIEEVAAYSRQKEVGLVLWVYWKGLNNQLEKALDQFQAWGAKGIKVDFMDRDDQEMVNFYYRVSREAAERNLVIDFHGAYKPAGLRRAYPNVLTREGFIEFEYNGWTDFANPEHHVTLPFIRMVCGPVDYIPGTLNNSTKKNFRPVGDRPMGLGTRAHSLALAVIMESPLQMIPDSPSDYYREDECTRFLTQIPAEWDETIILNAELAEHISLVRRNGDTWYAAAITDWTSREMNLDFSFLPDGEYQCDLIQDGPNAHRRAIDYQKKSKRISNSTVLPIQLASGGLAFIC